MGYTRNTVPILATHSAANSNRRLRPRQLAAAFAALSFFGTVAIAPLSMTGALAIAAPAMGSTGAATQRFASASSGDPAIDLGVSEAEDLAAGGAPVNAIYTLADFMFRGAITWGGHKFTYYSQQVLPGEGLAVPGRHVNAAGYVADAEGFIVLAGSAPKGTVFDTPFGYQGKIYDRGTVGNHLDVYIR